MSNYSNNILSISTKTKDVTTFKVRPSSPQETPRLNKRETLHARKSMKNKDDLHTFRRQPHIRSILKNKSHSPETKPETNRYDQIDDLD